MRKNFAQILKDAKVNIVNEYDKFYDLFYGSNQDQKSAYQIISEKFINFYFRGTCLTIEEFNEQCGFHYEDKPDNITIEDLIGFIEYIQNMLVGYQGTTSTYFYSDEPGINTIFFFNQIHEVIDAIGYMNTNMDGVTIFVEKAPAVVAVAESELISKDLSYKLISYNHHSMKGNLNAKKETLLALANILEGKRKTLKKENSALEDDLFFIFNKFNLRHNNCDPGTKKYISVIAEMDKQSLEEWYDETYQMCLLAFMEIEHAERKIKFNSIKKEIEEKKT